jgi:hypothetical protein
MEHSLHSRASCPRHCSRGPHRLDVCGLSSGRWLAFFLRAKLDQWELIEADPPVVTFCEKPGTVPTGEGQRTIDFLLRYLDRERMSIGGSAFGGGRHCPPEVDVSAWLLYSVLQAEVVAARNESTIGIGCFLASWQRRTSSPNHILPHQTVR